jgi:hypothetical protein
LAQGNWRKRLFLNVVEIDDCLPKNFESDLLLGHSHDRLFVHADVVDTHAAEDGEGLDEVLVVLGEREVVELRSILLFNIC